MLAEAAAEPSLGGGADKAVRQSVRDRPTASPGGSLTASGSELALSSRC